MLKSRFTVYSEAVFCLRNLLKIKWQSDRMKLTPKGHSKQKEKEKPL